jgi:hypothetical protein
VSENYVRPPIVAVEPPSRQAAVWRFRITMFLILAALAVGIFLIAKAAVGGGEGSPDVGTLPHSQPAGISRSADLLR